MKHSKASTGYSKERFVDLKTEIFDCVICFDVVRDPKECTNCGSVFCSACIDDWIAVKNECPNRCFAQAGSIKLVEGALFKLYKNLDIHCKYQGCKSVLKLCELEPHEKICEIPTCANYEQCDNYVNIAVEQLKEANVCSEHCLLLKQLKLSNGNWNDVLCYIKQFSHAIHYKQTEAATLQQRFGATSFRLDVTNKGKNIRVNPQRNAAYLTEPSYYFRTVIGDTPFYSGCHYWIVAADPGTEHEIKSGVTLNKEFSFESSFSDHDFGYAYYGIGQLRHKSNSLGVTFGKEFKNSGKLEVFLDMNAGTFSFGKDGKYWGVAFRSEKLKSGPIWPAISLLHNAGFSLQNDIEVPHYFIK